MDSGVTSSTQLFLLDPGAETSFGSSPDLLLYDGLGLGLLLGRGLKCFGLGLRLGLGAGLSFLCCLPGSFRESTTIIAGFGSGGLVGLLQWRVTHGLGLND